MPVLVEFAIVQVTGGGAVDRALAPQLTATGWYGVLHDLRWLEVFNRSWWSFGLELAAVLAVRTGLTGAAVALAWTAPHRPSPGRIGVTALLATMLGMILLTPAATLLFMMSVAPLVWWFLAALVIGAVPMLACSCTMVPGGVRLPPWRGLAWIALAGLVLTLAGLATARSPGWVGVLPTAAAGLWNALSWRGLVGAVAGAPVRILAPALSAAVALVAVAATFACIALADGSGAAARLSVPAGPVIVVGGFRSRMTAGDVGTATVQGFSYAGLDVRDHPLPYGPGATYQGLGVLERRLARQVRILAGRSGRPVTLIAESEGTMVAKLYLLLHRHPPVRRVILLSPIVDAAQVSVPPAGARGWGFATRFPAGLAMKLIAATYFPATLDMPLVRSILRNGATLRRDMLCRVPGPAEIVYYPLSDGVASSGAPRAHIPVVVLPAVHGGLAATQSVFSGGRVDPVALVRRVGRLPARPSARWRVALDLVRSAAAAWQVPPLPSGAASRPPLPCR